MRFFDSTQIRPHTLASIILLSLVTTLLFLTISTPYRTVESFSVGQSASTVIGQLSFGTSGAAGGRSGLNFPVTSKFDPAGDLWIVDENNSRIVEYLMPFSTGEEASLVIGQPNFTSSQAEASSTGLDRPSDIAFDSTGDLWVADYGNNRIVEFIAPFTNGEVASMVLGQSNLMSHNSSTGASGLDRPGALAFDPIGNLWVVDNYNSRILEYTKPFYTGEEASLVIGQPNFSSNASATSASGLYYPTDLTFDSLGNLWVTDWGNNRVQEYSNPFSNGEEASLVLGQSDFRSHSTGVGATGLDLPDGLSFDSSGNLWVSDTFNNRVLEYPKPFSSYESASVVIGQASFISNTPDVTATGLHLPTDVTFDPSGNLWVTDAYNNRVLEYIAPVTSGFSTSSTRPSSNSSSDIWNFVGSILFWTIVGSLAAVALLVVTVVRPWVGARRLKVVFPDVDVYPASTASSPMAPHFDIVFHNNGPGDVKKLNATVKDPNGNKNTLSRPLIVQGQESRMTLPYNPLVKAEWKVTASYSTVGVKKRKKMQRSIKFP